MRKRMRPYYGWDQMPVLLTVPEAANLLRISEQGLRTILREGKLPALKIGRAWRVERDAVRRLMEGGEAA